jgi:AraC-like DNA-binding protein
MEREQKLLQIVSNLGNRWEEEKVTLYVPSPDLGEGGFSTWKGEYTGHVHLFPELFIQLSEESLFSFREGEYVLKPGRVLIVPPLTRHPEMIRGNRKNFRNLVVRMDRHNVNCHIGIAEGGRKSPRVSDLIFRFTRKGERLAALGNIMIDISRRGDRALLGDLFRTLVFYLEDIFLSGAEDGEKFSEKVLAACSQIRVELDNPKLTVRYLSGLLNCSPDYLSHLFHKEMGEKLSSYINRERIVRARTLLAETKLNCSETAWACGFSSPAYFNRIFKEKTGLTPREYKNSH